MTSQTKKSTSKKSTSNLNAQEKTTMSTKTHSKSSISNSSSKPTTVTTATTQPLPAVLQAPPPLSTIPSAPPGWQTSTSPNSRGVAPHTAELAVMTGAVQDITNFVNYGALLGSATPSQTAVEQTFGLGNQWSAMRSATQDWDDYARVQEGVAWRAMRTLMGRVKPAFELALKGDPTLATTYPSLTAFFAAKNLSAQRGASTRAANKKAQAAGQPAYHGQVGKERKKAAANAALAGQPPKAPAAPPGPQAAQPPPQPAPTTGAAPAPVVTNGATPH